MTFYDLAPQIGDNLPKKGNIIPKHLNTLFFHNALYLNLIKITCLRSVEFTALF